MGHRHENDGIAGKAGNDVRDPGPPHQTNLISFPKSNPPPLRSLDADGEDDLPSAFIPLEVPIAAVIARLRNRTLVKVVRVEDGEDSSHPL